jgi:multidrug resistance efflux pump
MPAQLLVRGRCRKTVGRSVAVALAALVGGGLCSGCASDSPVEAGPRRADRPEQASPFSADVAIASGGRVEGASEAIDIGAGVDGVIGELRAREGARVHRGDVLAVIDRRELHAALSAAMAAADGARQARARLLRGSRTEDRERADAEVTAAEAVVRQTESLQRRIAILFDEEVVAAAERDDVQRKLDVSRAELQGAVKRAELIKAPPLPEEVAKADADVRAAEEQIRQVQQMLDKTIVRAPIDGTVLRTMLKPGEVFSIIVPQPILTMADTSRLRVRAEVDERDVGRVFTGQRVLVRGDVWEGSGVAGHVARIRGQMGRRTVKTGNPAEKSDRDVLEVLVDLESGDPRLVVGLRVTALFLKRADGSQPDIN